jgi:hypothetical protein
MPPRPAIGSPLLSALKGETRTYAEILENAHENHKPLDVARGLSAV